MMNPVEMIEEIEDWERSAKISRKRWTGSHRTTRRNSHRSCRAAATDTLDVALGLAVGALVAFVVLGVLDFNYSLADRLGEVQRADAMNRERAVRADAQQRSPHLHPTHSSSGASVPHSVPAFSPAFSRPKQRRFRCP